MPRAGSATSRRYAKQASAAGYVAPSEAFQVGREEKEATAPPPAVRGAPNPPLCPDEEAIPGFIGDDRGGLP